MLTRIWPVSEKREAAEKGRDGKARTALPMATFSSSDILGVEAERNEHSTADAIVVSDSVPSSDQRLAAGSVRKLHGI